MSTAILFLDNDSEHITDLTKHIKYLEVVKVDDILPNKFATTPMPRRSYTKYFVGKKNKYAILNERVGDEPYTPSNGITNGNIKTITTWLKTSASATTKIILFDWDRTISVVEGFIGTTKISEFLPDTMEYLLGGETRVKVLKTLFKTLHASEVHVFIITNNSAASSSSGLRELFLKMIKHIDPAFEEENLICSAYEKSKTNALLKAKSFTNLYGTEKLSSNNENIFSWFKKSSTRKKLMIAATTLGTAASVAYTYKNKKQKTKL